MVDTGDIDMAIVIRPPFELQSDLRWVPLAHEPFRPLVPRDQRGTDWAETLAAAPSSHMTGPPSGSAS